MGEWSDVKDGSQIRVTHRTHGQLTLKVLESAAGTLYAGAAGISVPVSSLRVNGWVLDDVR